jgi:hypothetical protein
MKLLKGFVDMLYRKTHNYLLLPGCPVKQCHQFPRIHIRVKGWIGYEERRQRINGSPDGHCLLLLLWHERLKTLSPRIRSCGLCPDESILAPEKEGNRQETVRDATGVGVFWKKAEADKETRRGASPEKGLLPLFEWDLIREQTNTRLATARARERVGERHSHCLSPGKPGTI